jgi:hypothetical protein
LQGQFPFEFIDHFPHQASFLIVQLNCSLDLVFGNAVSLLHRCSQIVPRAHWSVARSCLRKDSPQLLVILHSDAQLAKNTPTLGNPNDLPDPPIVQIQFFGGKHEVWSNDFAYEDNCEHQAALDQDAATSSYDPINVGSTSVALRENRQGLNTCLLSS